MPQTPKTKRAFPVVMDHTMIRALREAALDRDQSAGQLIRELLTNFLDTEARSSALSSSWLVGPKAK